MFTIINNIEEMERKFNSLLARIQSTVKALSHPLEMKCYSINGSFECSKHYR